MSTRASFVLAVLFPLAAFAQPSPYAGQEAREIKALSAQEIGDLLHGRGMGFAKAAELNAFPGPAHALDMADDLGLSAGQVAALEAIEARMSVEARRLGAEIVEAERALDRLFRERRIDAASLAEATSAIGLTTGRLRAVHLLAHLETRALLTEEQVRHYDALRGYGGATGGGHGSHRHGG